MKFIDRILFSIFLLAAASVEAATSSGSGFFVSRDGFIATNNHVIDGASEIWVQTNTGSRHRARVVRIDAAHDLAVLRIDEKPPGVLAIRPSHVVRRGERVYALGFPQTQIQGIELKVTDGLISSLSGMLDSPVLFQITNPIQPGNSGGPLIMEDGQVVGIVTSTLNAARVLAVTGSLPQNVNYATKSSYLLELLNSVGQVHPSSPSQSRPNARLVDVIASAELAMVRIVATSQATQVTAETPRTSGEPVRPPAETARPPAVAALTPPPSAQIPADGELTVRIGHAGPLSGPQAHYGRDNENGVRMAVEDLNARGIVIGNRRIHFEVVSEDDGADPRRGVAVAQKFCGMQLAGVVGHLNSGTSIPASRVYNECGLPQITPSATNPSLTRPAYRTTYRLIADDNALGAGIALYAADVLKLRRVAVIHDRTAYGQGVAAEFKATAQAHGIEIVDEQYTSDRATDFMSVLGSLQARNPDGIFYGGMDSQAGPMLRQMEQLGMANVKFLGSDGVCTNELVKLASGAGTLGNVVCAEGGLPIYRMPGGAEWKRRYDARYPGQFQVYSPYTYDATFVLVDAMLRANSVEPRIFLSQLPNTNFKGVTDTIQFSGKGELKNPAISLSTYRNGRKAAVGQ